MGNRRSALGLALVLAAFASAHAAEDLDGPHRLGGVEGPESRPSGSSPSPCLSTREAIEDYLEDRGLSGLAWTDRDLQPLERSLRRASLGGELRIRYEAWENLLDLDWGELDRVDFSETRSRLWTSFALAGGAELEFELQGLLRREALARSGPSELFPPPAGSPGFDPGLLFENAPELELSGAELRLPGFNLLGRLAHIPATLTLGRQRIEFGEGFLLGAGDEGVGLRYDGARLSCETGSLTRLDLFWAKATPQTARAIAARVDGPVDPESDIDAELAGLRFESKNAIPDASFAAYLVSAKLGEVATTDPFHYETYSGLEVHTAGLEATVVLTSQASLRLETAAQWGEFGAKAIRDSFAAEARLRLGRSAFCDSEGRVPRWAGPRDFEVFAAFATGDRASTTGVHEGFLPVAQDARGRFDTVGLLSSRNIGVWGLRVRFARPGRAPELGFEFAQAFADEPDSPDGAGSLMNGSSSGGARLGELVSASVRVPLYGERPERSGSLPGAGGQGSRSLGELRAAVSAFLPGEYFESDSRDPAVAFTVEVRAGF